MPALFLTESERNALRGFPSEVLDDAVRTHFVLTDADWMLVSSGRGAHNRLGLAVQLCTVRWLGFCPDRLGEAPRPAVEFLAQQLNLPVDALALYGRRPQTRTTHLQMVLKHLGFKTAAPQDMRRLTRWLSEQAIDWSEPRHGLQLVIQKLRDESIVRPGITRLERLVIAARTLHQLQHR
jgi:hypothetical protein